MSILEVARADPRFLGPEIYSVFGALIKEQEYKSANTKLGTKLNIR